MVLVIAGAILQVTYMSDRYLWEIQLGVHVANQYCSDVIVKVRFWKAGINLTLGYWATCNSGGGGGGGMGPLGRARKGGNQAILSRLWIL